MERVIRHERSVLLCDVSFIVGRKGRQRVIDSGRKNVHAFVRGYICTDMQYGADWKLVTYNPFRSDSFEFRSSTGGWIPIYRAKFVDMREDGAVWALP